MPLKTTIASSSNQLPDDEAPPTTGAHQPEIQTPTICPQNLDALPIQIFDDANPGPSFEEVFGDLIYDIGPENTYTKELELGEDEEYFFQECEDCHCCQGFVYNCDSAACNLQGICFCAEGKTLEDVYFDVHS